MKHIVKPLLAWYDLHARRMPWRETVSPYRIWVSEIMLQQTRVETVIPYYRRFLEEFPTVESLAGAPEERLLKLWEGLGYYSRARNLQKAARAVVEHHGGRFPEHYGQLLALPGIGEYTAGAIASIAFGQPVPAVDGNVLRVVCRLTGDRRDPALPALRKEIRAGLAAVYPAGREGDFTQSLMELGATVCLPNGAPACPRCPLAEQCAARREGSAMDIPLKTPKKPRRIECQTVLLLLHGDLVALRRRAAAGLLGGLWEFPMLPGHLSRDETAAALEPMGLRLRGLVPAAPARHLFTHLEWHMHGWLAECAAMPPELTWVSRRRLREETALPTALKSFRDLLRQD